MSFVSPDWQARFPLIARVASAQGDAANGTATQPGGPNRYLLQANYTGSVCGTTTLHPANSAHQTHLSRPVL